MADEDIARDAIRLVREGGDRGPSLAEKLGDRIGQLRFQAPWYRMRLKGQFPLRLIAVPADPVPGDAKTGQRLKAGRLFRGGHGEAMAETRLDSETAPDQWRRWVHGWGWLRDMAATLPLDRQDIARTEALSRRWLARFPEWDATAWAPGLTGRRILMAIMYAPIVMPGTDHVHRSLVLNGIARWARHLDQSTHRLPDTMDKAEAIAGLLGAALMIPGGDARLARAEAMLAALTDQLITPDGAGVTRCPLDLARFGELLLTLTAFYAARGQEAAKPVQEALRRVRAGLSGLAMGDGVPAAWHGGAPSAAQMERLGAAPGAAAPGKGSGFQLLAAGATRVVVDAGPPPLARLNPHAHASTLALSMSDGDRLLVVNCGGERLAAGRSLPPELVAGLRSTAGHSTLTLGDCNSSRLGESAGRSGGVEEVVGEFRASEQGQWLEARHDGYRRRFGVDHLRRLWLSPDGLDLRGEDQLVPSGGTLARLSRHGPHSVAVRFHLGAEATATLTEDGRGALIKLADRRSAAGRLQPGPAWAFRASFNHAPGIVRIEPSLWIDPSGDMMQTQHLLLVAEVPPGASAGIGWSFRRTGR